MKNNVLAVLLGFCLSAVIFAGLEVFFRCNERAHWLHPLAGPPIPALALDHFARQLRAKYHQFPIFSWRPLLTQKAGPAEETDSTDEGLLPCCMGRHLALGARQFHSRKRLKVSRKLIYDAHFTIDQLGRRITPVAKNPSYNILMFGDSYTLGDGVNDEQSAPYQLAELRPNAQVYNLGLAGGGPGQFLYEVSLNPPPRLQDIKKMPTIAVYTAIAEHMERLFCRSICLRPNNASWMLPQPYYSNEGGHPVLRGFFDTDRGLTNAFYTLLSGSALFNFFNVVWPPRFTQKDFGFFAEVMAEAKRQIERQFPQTQFFVAMYPNAGQLFGPQMRSACIKQGLPTLDYSTLDTPFIADRFDSIPGDGHPSPITHFVFAHLLDDDLPKR